jgi:radical SAM superfamily enzyme YgiQ (UPF0313 family)
MNDITLVNPSYRNSKDKRFCSHLPIQCYPPLGLAYLAASLRNFKIPVEILDSSVLNIDEKRTAKILNKSSPKVVGVYVTSFTLHQVSKIIKEIKDKINSTIIVGGPHITHYPNSIFTLDADYGIVGDGEKSLVHFMQNFGKKKIFKTDGLIYSKNGKIFINPKKEIEKIDSLPFPARDMLPNKKYYSPLHGGKITTMVTSRGCPFDCIFCGLPNKKSYRKRNPKNVIEEIELLVKNGFEYVEIEDDCLTLDKKRIEEICKLIIKKKLKINWGCETRADLVDKKLLILMKRAGCTNVRYGIESGDERIRNEIIGKKISNIQIKEAMKNMKKIGLTSVCYFMFGNPTETKKTMQNTLDFALELDPDYADFHLPIPIPGSRLFEIAINEGKISRNVWDNVIKGDSIPVYVSNTIELFEMINMQKLAYKSFYTKTHRIIKTIMKIKNIDDLALKINTGLILARNQFI